MKGGDIMSPIANMDAQIKYMTEKMFMYKKGLITETELYMFVHNTHVTLDVILDELYEELN